MATSSISSLKRPLPDFAEESEAKRQRIEEPSDSLISRIAAREIGVPLRPHYVLDDFFQRGKSLLESGDDLNAEKFFDLVRVGLNSSHWQLAVSMAHLEEQNGLIHKAISTYQTIISDKGCLSPLASLYSGLCHLQLEDEGAFDRAFHMFHQYWCLWTMVDPRPFPPDLSIHYMQGIEHAIAEILPAVQRNQGLYEALNWLYFAQKDYGRAYAAAVKWKEIDDAFFGADLIQHLCLLKQPELASQEEAIAYFENEPDIEIEGEYLMTTVWVLVLKEGLERGEPRLLQAALKKFQAVDQLPLPALPYLFAAHFALGQINEALEVAHDMEEKKPGSALLQKTLCRLSQGIEPEIVENLQKVLEKKNGEPAFLNFVGHYLTRKSAELGIPLPAEAFFAWSRQF